MSLPANIAVRAIAAVATAAATTGKANDTATITTPIGLDSLVLPHPAPYPTAELYYAAVQQITQPAITQLGELIAGFDRMDLSALQQAPPAALMPADTGTAVVDIRPPLAPHDESADLLVMMDEQRTVLRHLNTSLINLMPIMAIYTFHNLSGHGTMTPWELQLMGTSLQASWGGVLEAIMASVRLVRRGIAAISRRPTVRHRAKLLAAQNQFDDILQHPGNYSFMQAAKIATDAAKVVEKCSASRKPANPSGDDGDDDSSDEDSDSDEGGDDGDSDLGRSNNGSDDDNDQDDPDVPDDPVVSMTRRVLKILAISLVLAGVVAVGVAVATGAGAAAAGAAGAGAGGAAGAAGGGGAGAGVAGAAAGLAKLVHRLL